MPPLPSFLLKEQLERELACRAGTAASLRRELKTVSVRSHAASKEPTASLKLLMETAMLTVRQSTQG